MLTQFWMEYLVRISAGSGTKSAADDGNYICS